MNLHKYLIICILTCIINLSIQSQTKYAIIVAIGKYADKEIPSISSLNDIPLIENALLKNGFEQKNIIQLVNEKATKGAVVKAIRKDLQGKIKLGDIVVLHFSTHGLGIPDINGDEQDGCDETIVCYDTPYIWPANYKGEKHLVDDELKVLLAEIRQKLGPKGQVLMLVDACYSGTIARGNDRFRTFQSPEVNPKVKVQSNPVTNQNRPAGINDIQTMESSKLAPYVVFSASSADEPNCETSDITGKSVGSLSYCFSKAMSLPIENMSFKTLFDCIKSEMAVCVPRQTPEAEGNMAKSVFSDIQVSSSTDKLLHFSPKQFLSDTTFILDAGGLSEIFEGAIIDLFPARANLKDSTLRKNKGVVISATEFESTIKLSKPMDKNQIMSLWAVIKAKSFAPLQQKVYLAIKDAAKVQKQLADDKIIKFVEKKDIFFADLIIEEGNSAYGEFQLLFIFKNIEDTVIVKLPDPKPETISKAVKEKITAYAKANYLRSLTQINSNLDVELQIIPVAYKLNNGQPVIRQKFDEKSVVSTGGQIVMNEGRVFIFRVINHGIQKAYLNIVDIQPDNNITLLIPDENSNAADISIMPNDTIDYDSYFFQVSAPYGVDMFKVIASAKPFNNMKDIFGSIATRSAASTRGKSPFEALLIETMDIGTRSVKRMNVPNGDVNIYTKVIRVMPGDGRMKIH